MMYFVDSSAWMAFFNTNDKFHTQAEDIFDQKPLLTTSNIVLHETIALLAKRITKEIALAAGKFILNEEFNTLCILSGEQEVKAWKHFRHKNSSLSFVDWTIKVMMDDKGIEKIFTFDSDFDAVGLKRVP